MDLIDRFQEYIDKQNVSLLIWIGDPEIGGPREIVTSKKQVLFMNCGDMPLREAIEVVMIADLNVRPEGKLNAS